ncbi:MAG: hypothetical protein M1833_000573 [Piccolia ochrophora]|nr:MAG: hypothetical protein M1833_000573 [Piccolia ochrophora]
MATPLPVLTSPSQCADFTKTVSPFISQLWDLPQRLREAGFDASELKQLYLATNPLITAVAVSLLLAPMYLVLSELTRNYSQVDRSWSILPTLYNAHFVAFAHMAGLPTERLDTLLAFSGIWSARLTYNYWRKGGYTYGSEDYRWEVLRQYINPALFFIFDVLFISLAQNLLLVSITFPTYVILLVSKSAGDQSTMADVVFSRILVGLVLVEWFADQQQWNFQQAKKEYQSSGKVAPKYQVEDLQRGFVVSGLWSWSRHPNFAAEQAIWAVLYQWSCYLTNSLFQWTAIGAVAYLFLFQASTWFTELITARKYPEYVEYRKRVGKFLPKLGTDPSDDARRQTRPPVGQDKKPKEQ